MKYWLWQRTQEDQIWRETIGYEKEQYISIDFMLLYKGRSLKPPLVAIMFMKTIVVSRKLLNNCIYWNRSRFHFFVVVLHHGIGKIIYEDLWLKERSLCGLFLIIYQRASVIMKSDDSLTLKPFGLLFTSDQGIQWQYHSLQGLAEKLALIPKLAW